MDSIVVDDAYENQILEKISKIANKSNLEIEYKFKLSNNHIIEILKEMESEWSSKVELDQTVNIIYGDIIKRASYHNNAKPVIDHYKKQRLFDIIFPYSDLVKLSVASEEPCTSPTSRNIRLIRVKNRITIPDDKYRIDITQVIEIPTRMLDTNPEIIKITKNNLFTPMLKGNNIYKAFIQSSDPSIKLEMELEYTDDDLSIDDLSIKAISNKIPKLLNLINSNIILSKVLKLSNKKIKNSVSIKNVLASAGTLTQNIYNNIYPPIGYYITNKADGERACLYISSTSYLITSENTKIIPITANKVSIFDCEVIEDSILMFDCLQYEDNIMINDPLPRRYEAINKFYEDHKNEKTLKVKKYFPITEELEKSFRLMDDYKFDYPEDGYILSSTKEGYYKTESYKIKQHNTIDFLAILVDESYPFPNKTNMSTYILFNGINRHLLSKIRLKFVKGYGKLFKQYKFTDYLPIQFSPADKSDAYLWYADKKLSETLSKYHGMYSLPSKKNWIIVELEPIFKDGIFQDWAFHRVRDDRVNEPNYFGNDFVKTAEVNWLASQSPLKLREMHKPADAYFAVKKSPIYFAQTASLSYAKSHIISKVAKLAPNLFVLDLAAGKGQDLGRYLDANYERGVFVDIDRIAIATLLSKRYEMIKTSKYYREKKFNVRVGVLNLNEPADDNYKKLQVLFGDEEEKPAFINCNLAIHYMLSDVKSLLNIIKLITMSIEKGGYFAYTTFNGKKVFNLLAENNGEWICYHDEVVKFRLKANYKSSIFSGFNQTISVKLPFSGDEMYEEPLVSIDNINEAFTKSGFKVIETGSILDIVEDEMRNEAKNLYSKLDEGDKKYLDLYHFTLLRYI